MACRYNCGKLYSKADVSNLRRHEKSGSCTGRLPQKDFAVRIIHVNGDWTTTTGRDSRYANTNTTLNKPDGLSENDHQQSSASDRPGFIHTHSTFGSTNPARGARHWRDCQLTVEAIETLQSVFADGPAADALQAFTKFLNNLGPSIYVCTVSRSVGLDEECEETSAKHSDKLVDLNDDQQRGCQSDVSGSDPKHERITTRPPGMLKRRIDNSNETLSQVSPKKHRPVKTHEVLETSMRQDVVEDEYTKLSSRIGDENSSLEDCIMSLIDNEALSQRFIRIKGHMIQVALKVRIEFSRTNMLMMIKTILALTTSWSTMDLPHNSTVLIDPHSRILKATSSSSFQRLCPRVISLASLFLWGYERTWCTLCEPKASEPCITGFSVMLAAILYDAMNGVADEAWAEIIGLHMTFVLDVRNDFEDMLTEDLWVIDMSELRSRLRRFFDHHAEFVHPSG
jgi:hypothetical protein